MPQIYDNIDTDLLKALNEALSVADRADFCVGYLNLRGWRAIDTQVERFAGTEQSRVRLLVGMRQSPEEELRAAWRLTPDLGMDNQTAARLKQRMALEFRNQLTLGAPTNADESGLQRLRAQLLNGKLKVKLHLRNLLHAKLYLIHRSDKFNPRIGFVGSSNLTFAGLSAQGELNVDVPDSDATDKLAHWFEERWADRWSLDITNELAEVINQSWAGAEIPPYYIYLKMAYHLSQEARAGLSEFQIPAQFRNTLFDFQKAAVQIAAHHVNRRGGALIGDVVGLGKTLMATALARVFQEDHGWRTLIICPASLVRMWKDYVARYGLTADVMSSAQAPSLLAPKGMIGVRHYQLVLIDESHNLRNREGARYKAIHDYIEQNESHCILLSATPYNKSFLDLSAQLRLFVKPDRDLGIRPDRLVGELGEVEFVKRYQCAPRTLAAFEKSPYADDWRELMRLFMVRRTRGFIQANYARVDANGQRFLTMPDGQPSYFPVRAPRTVKFRVDDANPADPYARLYSAAIVDAINGLSLPRYGLGNYITPAPAAPPTLAEAKQLEGLGRAGKRLMGFCRTNLFKRLESGGPAFIQSVERHILRNYVYLHAIESDLPLPLGTQDAELLDPEFFDPAIFDEDTEAAVPGTDARENDDAEVEIAAPTARGEAEYRVRAAAVYAQYAGPMGKRFKWLRPGLFVAELRDHLLADTRALLRVRERCGQWRPEEDAKLNALHDLLTVRHAGRKVLVFTQFADTARYLAEQLQARGVTGLAGVTGDSSDPTALAWRFSPLSNEKTLAPGAELRALVATDVLSEGQNLQDCAIIVNFDLPWAIIRLIQRAGRVDRIGQRAGEILCYSFLPADGVERIIRLRQRVRQRLRENAEVVGTDEAFFEDETNTAPVLDIYNERAGIYDGDDDRDIDLSSQAYQIWKSATEADPSLAKTIPALPSVVYSTRAYTPAPLAPPGVLLYMRTADGNDALAWVDERGNTVTQSQLAILRAAACSRDTPGMLRLPEHHALVERAAARLAREDQQTGGALGSASGARLRVYERLQAYARRVAGTLWETSELLRAVEDIYNYPLRERAKDALNRQLKSGISDEALANLVITRREDGELCAIPNEDDGPAVREPRIICSLGLAARGAARP